MLWNSKKKASMGRPCGVILRMWVGFFFFKRYYYIYFENEKSAAQRCCTAEDTGPIALVVSPFQMAVWWQSLILPCCILVCVVSSAPVSPRNKYNISFRLARSTRTQVQQLNKKYVSAVCDLLLTSLSASTQQQKLS